MAAKNTSTDINELLHAKREDILRTAARHGASNVRVFGSVARGEAGPSSDIDFVVELAPDRSLLDQVALLQDLEDLLGRRVDVVEPEGLHWYIRDRVLKEAVPL
ncbi:MAG TPA: nucleotidyltransferase family protein [Chloroflexia bacterium]